MFLSIQELEVKKIHFDVYFGPGEVDYDQDQLKQISPLHAEGSAELLSNTLGEIRIQGRVEVDLEVQCDRCLEPVKYPMNSRFDLFYRPTPDEDRPHDMAIDEGESEIGFYEGAGLELEEVLREHILLSLPMQQICREDCAGICPQCGLNRNAGHCDCEQRPADDRWSALREFKPRARTGS